MDIQTQELNETKTEDKLNHPTYFTIIINYIVYSGKIIFQFIVITIQLSKIYLMWILLHYFASHLYVKLCTPSNLWGFFMTPFLTSTPYCQGLRWVIYNGANMINHMWIILATWLCTNVFILKNIIHNTNT
jgi:hypothetical protein